MVQKTGLEIKSVRQGSKTPRVADSELQCFRDGSIEESYHEACGSREG